MSASVVHPEHINAMADAGLSFQPGAPLRWYQLDADGRTLKDSILLEETAGAMLLAENQRSVSHRYSEGEIEQPFLFRRGHRPIDPVRMLRVIECYEYESRETGDWRMTEAYAFCRALQQRVISALPGIDATPWGSDELRPGHTRPAHLSYRGYSSS